jgi:hypothetical protein
MRRERGAHHQDEVNENNPEAWVQSPFLCAEQPFGYTVLEHAMPPAPVPGVVLGEGAGGEFPGAFRMS